MTRLAYPLLVLTMLFWGGNAVAGKLAVGHISPMLLTSLRWAGAFALLLVLGRARLAADWAAVRHGLPLLAGLGFAGFTLFNVALYLALVFTTAINGSIEQAWLPMLIFAGNFLAFGVRVSAGQAVGFLLSVAGVLLTATHGEPARLLDLDLNVGDALIVGACFLYAGYTLALRYRPDIHWLSLMTVLCGAAFLTSLLFAAAEAWLGHGNAPDALGWSIVAYTVIFPSLLSQAFYIRGVELIGANRAGLFMNLIPIFGTLLSVAILGEAVHPYHAVALLLAFGGIALAEWSGRRMAEAA